MPSRLEGVPELLAVLHQLPNEIERRVVRDALMAGARIIAARMRAGCPVGGIIDKDKHPGFTKSHIRARMATARQVGQIAGISGRARRQFALSSQGKSIQWALAGVTGAAYWAKFVEYGWILTTHKPGHRQVKHISAKPFLRPAFEATRAQAQAAISERLALGVQDAARRLAGP